MHDGFSSCILSSFFILCVGFPLLLIDVNDQGTYSGTRSLCKIRPWSTKRKLSEHSEYRTG